MRQAVQLDGERALVFLGHEVKFGPRKWRRNFALHGRRLEGCWVECPGRLQELRKAETRQGK
jgi:hypothetical protein